MYTYIYFVFAQQFGYLYNNVATGVDLSRSLSYTWLIKPIACHGADQKGGAKRLLLLTPNKSFAIYSQSFFCVFHHRILSCLYHIKNDIFWHNNNWFFRLNNYLKYGVNGEDSSPISNNRSTVFGHLQLHSAISYAVRMRSEPFVSLRVRFTVALRRTDVIGAIRTSLHALLVVTPYGRDRQLADSLSLSLLLLGNKRLFLTTQLLFRVNKCGDSLNTSTIQYICTKSLTIN